MLRRLVHSRLQRHVDSGKLSQTLDDVHRHTQGRIHVRLAPHFRGNVRNAAETAFRGLPSADTSVLFFVVPSRKEFTVLAGPAVHGRLGQGYWDELAADLGKTIRATTLTDGLLQAINSVGEKLADHFPGDEKNVLQ